MKIAILVRILWSAGTQKFAIQQAKALTDMGHDVELIFLRRGRNGSVYDDLLKGVSHRVLFEDNQSILVPLYDYVTGIFMSSRKGDGRVDYNLIRKFPSIIKNKYDLIICQDQFAGIAGYYSWRRFHIPYVVILHERINKFPWVHGIKRILVLFALEYQKKVILKAQKVLSLAKGVAVSAENFYSKYKLKVFNNFPGVDSKEFLDFSKKANTVILLSYWREDKAPELYIDIFRKLVDFKFLMIGNWLSESYKQLYMAKLNDGNLSSRVRLISDLSEDAKNNLIESSKFYLRFGKGEKGTGYGSVEALEQGVPIIVSRELGIVDEIGGYTVGLVVEDSNKTDKIIEFIRNNNNPSSYRKLQDGIKEFVKDHSWRSHCEKLLDGLECNNNQTG